MEWAIHSSHCPMHVDLIHSSHSPMHVDLIHSSHCPMHVDLIHSSHWPMHVDLMVLSKFQKVVTFNLCSIKHNFLAFFLKYFFASIYNLNEKIDQNA